jgi:hypothetical protein
MCDKCIVIISKAHYESTIFLIPLKSVVTWIIKNLTILMLNMTLYFMVIYNSKDYNYDSPNSPPNCAFTHTFI